MTRNSPSLGASAVRGGRGETPAVRSALRDRFGLDRTASGEVEARRVEGVRQRFGLDDAAGISTRTRKSVGGLRDTRGRALRTSAEEVSRRLSRTTGSGATRVGGSPRFDGSSAGDARGSRVTIDRLSRAGSGKSERLRIGRVPPPRARVGPVNRIAPLVPIASTPAVGSVLTPLSPITHVHLAGTSASYSYGSWNSCWSPWYSWPSWSFTIGFGWSSPYPSYSYYYGSCYEPAWSWCSPGYVLPFRRVCYSSPWWYRTRCYSSYRPYHCSTYPYAYTFSSYYGYRPCYSTRVVPVWYEVETPVAATPELSTAELRFCEGWSLLRGGDPETAAQILYSASLEAEDSALVHWFLALALAGSGDLELASHTLGVALALDPAFLAHRWVAQEHLGADGEAAILAACRARLSEDPLAADALAVAGSLALLSDDAESRAELRGRIAESLLLDPEAPALAEILAGTRRRAEGSDAPHPATLESAWLASPSCENLPGLGL